jgi:ParB family chromosome partitioning protein
MTKGNKGFSERFGNNAVGLDEPPPLRRVPPLGVLDQRDNALSKLASGVRVEHDKELVDPARCIIWADHNRDYGALNAVNCQDLIESLISHGKQEIPAIVRRLKGVPDKDYEIICGARRHWSVTWLRAHNYPDFRLLVEVRHLSDEEAFRVADLENRGRRDISDYERANDYLKAIEKYYGGSQQKMVERLNVSKSWMSRYLDLARLPQELVAAFGSPHGITVNNSRELWAMWKNEETRALLKKEAMILAEEQATLMEKNEALIAPLAVVRRLAQSTKPVSTGVMSEEQAELRSASGRIIIKIEKIKSGGIKCFILPKTGASRDDLVKAFSDYISTLPNDAPLG